MIYIELFVSFLLIGFTSFGGMSMIPLINAEMLSHGWMTATEVSDIVAIAEMTPGPLGINCATFAGTRVMMADELDTPMRPGTAMYLVITMDNREEVMQAFRVLEEGGRVIYPPRATAYSSCTCSLTDRYGFRWNIMTEQTER